MRLPAALRGTDDARRFDARGVLRAIVARDGRFATEPAEVARSETKLLQETKDGTNRAEKWTMSRGATTTISLTRASEAN